LEWVQLEWVLINRYVGPGLGLFFRAGARAFYLVDAIDRRVEGE